MIERADVAIIGGGIMGASTAFNLARDTRLKVVLLEKDVFGGGSTGRSAAIIRHYYSNELMLRSAIESRRIFQNFKSAVGESLEFVQNGFVALDAGEPAKTAHKRVEEMKRSGLRASTLLPSQARERFPFLTVADDEVTSFDEEAGFVPEPTIATEIYVRQAVKHGASAYEHTGVTKIRYGRAVRSVVTSKGEIEVSHVLNAAGPWGREVSKMVGLNFPIESVRQQLVDFKTKTSWPLDRPTVSDRRNITYLKPVRGGIAHAGGHYYGKPCDPDRFDNGVDQEFVEGLIPKLVGRFPELGEARVVAGYSGLYEDSPDKMPLVGETEVEGYTVCAGWSGHGFKHGPFFGILLKELIEKGRASMDISSLSPGRFMEGRPVVTDYSAKGTEAPVAPYG